MNPKVKSAIVMFGAIALIAIAFLIMCSGVNAGSVAKIRQTRTERDLNGKIVKASTWGSGAVIGHRANGQLLVLTCSHVVNRGDEGIFVQFDGVGVAKPATVLQRDTKLDLCLLRTEDNDKVSITVIDEYTFGTLSKVKTAGFVASRRLVRREVRVIRFSPENETIVDKPFAHGESGGPVTSGENLVGIIRGKLENGDGVVVSLPEIREFVIKVNAEIPIK